MRKRILKRITATLLALVLTVPAFYAEAVPVPVEEHDVQALLAFSEGLNAMIRNHEQSSGGTEDDVLSAAGIPEEFAAARLIVKSEKEIESLNAVGVVSGFRDLHVLQFNTPAEAYRAYQLYRELNDVVYVEPDQIYDVDPVEIDDSVDSGFETESNMPYYNSWGYAPRPEF